MALSSGGGNADEAAALDSLWRTVQSLEQELTAREVAKRKDRKVLLHDPSLDRLRLALLESGEDILLSDHPAAAACWDERLFRCVFYLRFEELRSIIAKWEADMNRDLPSALEAMRQHLEMATFFYQTLIMTLLSRLNRNIFSVAARVFFKDSGMTDFGDDDVANEESQEDLERKMKQIETRYLLLHRSVIYLGDIGRYMATFCSHLEHASWNVPKHVYTQAIHVNPDNGKPHSQLAIIATTNKEYFDAIYWYSLSAANNVPFPMWAKNLHMLHAKVAEKERLGDLRSFDASGANEKVLLSVLTGYHRLVTFPSDETLDKMENLDTALAYHDAQWRALSQLAEMGLETNALMRRMMQVLISLMVGYTLFEPRFKSADKPSIKQRIRNLQILSISTVFQLTSKMMDTVHATLQASFDAGFDPFTTDEDNDGKKSLELLGPAGITCVFLAGHLEVFDLFGRYTAAGTALAFLNEKMTAFFRSLAQLVNTLSSFADMDGSRDCLPEDAELLGLAPMASFYKKRLSPYRVMKLLDGVLPRPSELVAARVARVAWAASVISDEKTIDLFSFDEKTSKFIVRDEETKRAERQKVGKALAVELLKDQIGSLEQSLKSIAVIPCVVFAADVYTNHLPFIKSLLMSRVCKIILPIDVMRELDRSKSGNEYINRRSREAIRYLEQRFKYRSEFLVAQQAGEEVNDLWDSEGNIVTIGSGSGNVDSGVEIPVPREVPRHMRGFLRCCGYFQRKVVADVSMTGGVNDGDLPFVLVSGDQELLDLASSMGIVRRSVREWKAWSNEVSRRRKGDRGGGGGRRQR